MKCEAVVMPPVSSFSIICLSSPPSNHLSLSLSSPLSRSAPHRKLLYPSLTGASSSHRDGFNSLLLLNQPISIKARFHEENPRVQPRRQTVLSRLTVARRQIGDKKASSFNRSKGGGGGFSGGGGEAGDGDGD